MTFPQTEQQTKQQTLTGMEKCTHVITRGILEKNAANIEETMMNNLMAFLQNEDNKNAYFNAGKLNEQIQGDIHAVLLNILMRDVVYYKQILYSLLTQKTIQEKISIAINEFIQDKTGLNKKSLYQKILKQIKPVEKQVGEEAEGKQVEEAEGKQVEEAEEKGKEAKGQEANKASQEKDTIDNILALNARDATVPYINKKIFKIYTDVMRKTIQTKEQQKKILEKITDQISVNSLNELTTFMNGFGETLHLTLFQKILFDESLYAPMRKLLEDVVNKYKSSLIDDNGNVTNPTIDGSLDGFNKFIQKELVPETIPKSDIVDHNDIELSVGGSSKQNKKTKKVRQHKKKSQMTKKKISSYHKTQKRKIKNPKKKKTVKRANKTHKK